MNTKQIALTSGLGLTLVLCIISILISFFYPAQANTDLIVTPTPTISLDEVTQDRHNIPVIEHITDIQKKTIPENMPLSSSSAHIANGDFENGQDGSWQEHSTHGWDIIVNTSTLPPSPSPHSGSWVAWLGGDYDDISFISQGVTIPAGASALSYWYWIGSLDSCGYDFGWVKINNTNLQIIDLCEDNNTNGWVEKIIDISAYAGQVVTLQIRVETDGSLNSNFFVDDVILDVGSYSYLPITFNNFWAGYFDDFGNPNSGWPIYNDDYSSIGYLNGEYQIYIKNEDGGFWVTPGSLTGRDLFLPSDYRVEVDARKVSTGAGTYGLKFGQQYTSTSIETYQILIDPTSGEFILDKELLDDNWFVIIDWTYSSAINQGAGTNHIAVERIGSTIKLYINSVQVANTIDSSLLGPGRDAGLIVYSYNDAPVDVRFDNFAASQP